jgi:hypothetical protein
METLPNTAPTSPPPPSLVIAHTSTNRANALAARSILIGWGFEGVAYKIVGSVHKVGVRREDLPAARTWLAGAYKNRILKPGISLP